LYHIRQRGGTRCQTSVEISLHHLTVAHRNDSFFMASPKFLSPRAEPRGLYRQIAISYPILASPNLGEKTSLSPWLRGRQRGGTRCQTSVEIYLHHLTVVHRN